uniref:Uncharacterized protein n=1 Tax=Plectus sambesii TaxID=2011161 RepID=A0A914XHI9_9BILA
MPRVVRVNNLSTNKNTLWDKEPGQEEEKTIGEGLFEVPMGRMGTPEECSGAVSFLCSDDASYITGETIVIAGGIHARL